MNSDRSERQNNTALSDILDSLINEAKESRSPEKLYKGFGSRHGSPIRDLAQT